MAKGRQDKMGEINLQPVEISADLPSRDGSAKVGMKINRLFTKAGKDVFSEVSWEKRSSIITDEKGNLISHITEVEVPSSWTQLATDILAYKYLRKAGVPTKEGRETSLKQAIFRIAHTIADFGEKFGYFSAHQDRVTFEDELSHLLLHQKAAFNSPVWFNCGLYHQYGIEGQGGAWFWDFKQKTTVETKSAYRNPQCSACFILSVRDTLPAIFEAIKTESHIFKYGSGSGANFSGLRSRYERLSGGGFSSGMMSFLRVFDRAAGATKSGGTTRRAAKMVVVDIDHPEVEDFINWKANEELKAAALINAGYESDFNGEAYSTVSGQNANNSVRVTDEFMEAVENDGEWQTRMVTTKEPHKTYKAREMMRMIADAAWKSADPGLQFDTTINNWHTSANTDRIYASNPCSEYMFLNDSACNLASINLVKFIKPDGSFDIAGYRHACRLIFIAQEIEVDLSSYPTEPIARNSHDYRPLGMGYANLGTLLMLKGIPYDSDEGRAIGGALTAIMTGHDYKTSAEMAGVKGPFAGYLKNRAPMLKVMKQHRDAAYKIDEKACPSDLLAAAKQDWDEAVALGEQLGYRNAQATVIAPTGTIGLLMDCDTTGVEPDFAIVKFKKLAGGGSMKIVNNSVTKALENLGYSAQQQREIIQYAIGTGTFTGDTPINQTTLKAKGLTDEELNKLEAATKAAFDINYIFNRYILGDEAMKRLGITAEDELATNYSVLQRLGFTNIEIQDSNEIICGTQMLEGAPHLKPEHYPVFDCANKCGSRGTRYLSPMSHVKMMAAVQPFISGAISKTVNMPNDATVEDIQEVYMQSWKLGLKALAVYRDGSKLSQPLNTKKEAAKEPTVTERIVEKVVYAPQRRRLPDERQALTHKFRIAGYKGYLTVGLFEDGKPGEIFITMSKQGSVISGLMDAFATAISISLQYGVPLTTLIKKFSNSRFEPSGLTSNPQIRLAKSFVDYIFRYLGLKFLTPEEQIQLGIAANTIVATNQTKLDLPTKTEELETSEDTLDTSDDIGKGFSAAVVTEAAEAVQAPVTQAASDAPPCPSCGSMTTKTGTCYTCLSCGSTTGGCS